MGSYEGEDELDSGFLGCRIASWALLSLCSSGLFVVWGGLQPLQILHEKELFQQNQSVLVILKEDRPFNTVLILL